MSFILKALKKVEKEKASRETGQVALSTAILASDSRGFSSSRKSHGMIIIIPVLIVAACVWYFSPFTSTTRVAHPPAAAPGTVSDGEPAPDGRGGGGGNGVGSPSSMAIPHGVPVQGESPAPAAKAPEENEVFRNTAGEKGREAPPERGSGSVESSERQLPLVAAPSSLIVNGIALQDDPSKSIAVVNGRILKMGMTIEGARVDRIFLDRVRFRGNGGMFEVRLAK